jgi:hypothetical protein
MDVAMVAVVSLFGRQPKSGILWSAGVEVQRGVPVAGRRDGALGLSGLLGRSSGWRHVVDRYDRVALCGPVGVTG